MGLWLESGSALIWTGSSNSSDLTLVRSNRGASIQSSRWTVTKFNALLIGVY